MKTTVATNDYKTKVGFVNVGGEVPV